MRSRWLLWVLLCLLCLPTAAAAELTISFGKADVTVSDATRYGDVALVSIARISKDWTTQVKSLATLVADDNGDGEVTLDLKEPAADRSLWAVIDVASGEAILASPGLAGVPMKVDVEEIVKKGEGGVFNELAADRAVLDLTVVRPGEGAWHTRAWDGGTNDKDIEPNGEIRIRLQDMEALDGGSSRLDVFDVGDVLIGMDHGTLEFYAVQITSPPGRS